MQVRTWFGIFTLDKERIVDVELFQNDIDAIVNHLDQEPLLLRGKAGGFHLHDLAIKYGFVSSKEEYQSLLHEINIKLAKKQLAQAATPERNIIEAVEAIDDIYAMSNSLSERLREWYMMNFDRTNLKGFELARHIVDMKENSPELRTMQSLASCLLGLYETRLFIEEYLEERMIKLAPNLTSITGYTLGARLLSIAGSLERLASMPSSTVQVLGANNALFKHLKGKAPSPKHGVIYRHPYVNTAPKWQRGKVARAVASKISIAARHDCYSGEFREELRDELEKKVNSIKKRDP
jgi:nucleolar protein 56